MVSADLRSEEKDMPGDENDLRSGAQPEQPTGSSDDTAPNLPALPSEGQSRRNFLRAAVISSAAVVAAGGVAAATLASTGNSPSTLIRFVGSTVSPTDPCDVCGSATQDVNGSLPAKGFTGNPNFGNSESMYIWVKFTGVPTGSYSFNVTPTIQPKMTGNCTGQPYSFQSGSSDVKVYQFANGPLSCVPSSLASLPSASFTSSTLPISLSVSSGPVDLLFQLHLGNDCTSGGTTTVTGTLTNTGTDTSVHCSNDITVDAKKKDK
jgi:hypothetical protein